MTLQELIRDLSKRIPAISALDTPEHVERVRTRYLMQLSEGRYRDVRPARVPRVMRQPPPGGSNDR